jgi:integrase
MELVTVKGATKRMKRPRSLTVEEFQVLREQLEEPFRTMALVCVCFGLRISECMALKWADVDWLNGTLYVERGIVHQVVDDVKTPESQRSMCIDSEMLDVLKMLAQRSNRGSVTLVRTRSGTRTGLGSMPLARPLVCNNGSCGTRTSEQR